MKKAYTKPSATNEIGKVGFPTVLAIGAAAAAVGAASVAVGRVVGSILPIESQYLVNELPVNKLATV